MKKLSRIIGTGIGVVAALVMSASIAQAQNILVNGNFGIGFTADGTPPTLNTGGYTPNPITTTSGPGGTSGVGQGWATFGAGPDNMTSAASSPESGGYALLAQNAPGNNWNPQGAYQIVGGINAGWNYTLSAYYLADSLYPNTGTYATPIALQLGFGNLAGNTWTSLSSTTWGFGDNGSNDGSIPALDTWYQGSVTAQAPVGASEAVVYLFYMDNGQTTVDSVFFSNAQLVGVVPEPTTLALMGLGLTIPLYVIRRRKS